MCNCRNCDNGSSIAIIQNPEAFLILNLSNSQMEFQEMEIEQLGDMPFESPRFFITE
jgi:hypothetical protein